MRQPAGDQPVVRWQTSQSLDVGMCRGGLPVAVWLLWQPRHSPITALWSTVWMYCQPVSRWQASHSSVVRMWVSGGGVAFTRPASEWQAAHCRAVPWKMPPTWQLAHSTFRCAGRHVVEVAVEGRLGQGPAGGNRDQHQQQ
jgi:hypothetical protein